MDDPLGAEVREALGRLPASIGFDHDAVVRLLGGLTNRVYEVTDGRGAWVLRVPGAGVGANLDRVAERHNHDAAARLGLAPEVAHMDEADGLMLTRRVEGAPLTPERLRNDAELLARVADVLGRLHRSGADFRGRFHPVELTRRHLADARRLGGSLPGRVDDLVAAAERAWSETGQPGSWAPCHNDPWPENLIDGGDRLWLVDWEYSAMGDPVWDLADLSVEVGLDTEGDHLLVESYEPADADGTIAVIARLKPVCDLLWGAWALAQQASGNVAIDYRAYGERRIDRASGAFATT